MGVGEAGSRARGYMYAAATAAKSLQSCLTLCDPIDGSPPGSPVPGILQARTLEWVAISFSGDLPDPGIEPRSPELSADSLLTELRGKPYINHMCNIICIF